MPSGKNPIPLRKGPEPETLRQSRDGALAAEKRAERRRLEEEAKLALLEAHNGPVGFHAENSFAATTARPPMPVERNRLPLRKAEVVSQRAKELQAKKKRDAENRAMALAAAQAAHERLRRQMRAQGRTAMHIEGVIQHNPFPVREVPPGGTLSSGERRAKGKVYDFSQISNAARNALLSEGEDADILNVASSRKSSPGYASSSSSSRKNTPGTAGSTPNTYSYTMADGTVLTHKSMSMLEKMIAEHRRKSEQKRTKRVVKRMVGTQKKMSGAITSSKAGGAFDRQGKKYATPVEQTKKFKKFYSPGYTAPDTSSQEETDALVKEFERAMGKYQKAADRRGEGWLAAAQQSMDTLEGRTEGIAMAGDAVDSYAKLMTQGDSLAAGDGKGTSKNPGFLSQYVDSGSASKAGKASKATKKGGAGAATKGAKGIATKLQKAADKGKADAAADDDDDEVDLEALKAQLESQGVKVDQKMLDIMASLGTNKKAPASPEVKKSDAMAAMESALHHDEGEED